MKAKPIGEILKELGYITEEQKRIALEIQKLHKGKKIGEILEELAFVSPKDVAQALSYQYGRPYIDLREVTPTQEALKIIDKKIAEKLEILPIRLVGKILFVAVLDPSKEEIIERLRRMTGYEIEYYITDRESFYKAIKTHYYLLENPVDKHIKEFIQQVLENPTVALNRIPEFAKNILNMAVLEKATDIHITPTKLATQVFYRIDGIMRHYYAIPSNIHDNLMSYIKLNSGMDIAERRRPQDGSFTHKFFDEEFDMRVSTVPTQYGENMVIRILSKNASLFKLKNLGFEEDIYKKLQDLINKPQGIILVTGPTGSGKTTTLYALLREINVLEKNVLTAEDPIEYKFPFVRQTNVNEKINYNFATAIRHFLRQDPDIILIGEIRDEETAQMAIRASITGHLVLSTLHTNSSVGAIPRLVDMGIKSYMVAAGLVGVIAQRLARRVCQFCITGEEYDVKEFAEKYGYSIETIERINEYLKSTTNENYIKDGKIKIHRGKGCDHCKGTGYQGRITIAELLEVDKDIEELISRDEIITNIEARAREKGMRVLKEDGLIKILKGITSPEEIRRVIG
jgi:type IV pilus assembly protein PilB